MTAGTVILGAGQSGFSVAARLRSLGYDREVIVLGDEASLPYQRPPLSKKLLAGSIEDSALQLRPEQFFREQRIDVRTRVRVVRIDKDARCVHLDNGSALAFEHLVLATGTRARQLPETLTQGLGGLHVLRSMSDAFAIRSQLQPGRRLVVIGGGFVGLEAAATARSLGLDVTVVEQADRILQRVAGAGVSQRLGALHKERGVHVLEGRRVDSLRGVDGQIHEVVLDGDQALPADLVLVGIGALPNVELARDCGLDERDGILVNEHGMTSAPGIYACGDCARFPVPSGATLRLESVQNAIAMGECVAQAIAGKPVAYAPVPWFWSDQYDCKLQMVGLTAGADRVVVRDAGSSPTTGVSFWHFKGPQLLALEALNDAGAFVQARRWLEQQQTPNPTELADAGVPLRSVSVQ